MPGCMAYWACTVDCPFPVIRSVCRSPRFFFKIYFYLGESNRADIRDCPGHAGKFICAKIPVSEPILRMLSLLNLTASPTKNPSPPLLAFSKFSSPASDFGSFSSRNFFRSSAYIVHHAKILTINKKA